MEQDFNSLHAQREACEAYVNSQRQEGWQLIDRYYDDGGFSGGNIERPALQRLKDDIAAHQIDLVLVYKVDRLSRSLADFVQLIQFFEEHEVAFAAVTQQFNTSTSMGRLTLNVLLSFAQFEREVTSERIRDKIAASNKKGMWMGGCTPLGYCVQDRKLHVVETDAELVRHIYNRYRTLKNVRTLKAELESHRSPMNEHPKDRFSRGRLYTILKNPIYAGLVSHKGVTYTGEHEGIVDHALWQDVQNILADNRQDQQTKGQHLSLLAGLLFDDAGYPMSPTHTRKGKKRYRYYISQALLRYREDQAGSVQRIAAHTLEETVVSIIHAYLHDSRQVIDRLQLDQSSPHNLTHVLEQANGQVSTWQEHSIAHQKNWLNDVVQNVTVSHSKLTMVIDLPKLRERLGGEPTPALPITTLTLSKSVSLQRTGRESRLVIEGEPITASTSSVSAMQDALRQGLMWSQQLQAGEHNSFSEIAEANRVTPAYVRRLCQLSLLAPDLMERIVVGKIPANLTLERLKSGIPLEWPEQRRQLL